MKEQNELKSERCIFMLEKSLLETVDEWGFSRRIRSRGEAVRQLLHLGMEVSETKKADAQA